LCRFSHSLTAAVLLFCSYLMRKVMENIERLGSMSKLLILGDALFYKLSKTKERWQPLEQRYAAINLGAPGDRTENILKRFEDGQHLLNITSEGPTMLLQVGASNALLRDSPSAIMAGIDAVLSLLRTHLKKPRFILLSLLPRGFPGAPVNETIREVNKLLSAEYGLKRHEDVEYANVAKVRNAPLVLARFSLFPLMPSLVCLPALPAQGWVQGRELRQPRIFQRGQNQPQQRWFRHVDGLRRGAAQDAPLEGATAFPNRFLFLPTPAPPHVPMLFPI